MWVGHTHQLKASGTKTVSKEEETLFQDYNTNSYLCF